MIKAEYIFIIKISYISVSFDPGALGYLNSLREGKSWGVTKWKAKTKILVLVLGEKIKKEV